MGFEVAMVMRTKQMSVNNETMLNLHMWCNMPLWMPPSKYTLESFLFCHCRRRSTSEFYEEGLRKAERDMMEEKGKLEAMRRKWEQMSHQVMMQEWCLKEKQKKVARFEKVVKAKKDEEAEMVSALLHNVNFDEEW